MIEVKNNKIKLSGSGPMLLAELSMVVSGIRTLIENELCNEQAQMLIKETVKLGLMSDEDVEKECKKFKVNFKKKECENETDILFKTFFEED